MSTAKKSAATSVFACAARNCSHVSPARRPAGGRPARLSTLWGTQMHASWGWASMENPESWPILDGDVLCR